MGSSTGSFGNNNTSGFGGGFGSGGIGSGGFGRGFGGRGLGGARGGFGGEDSVGEEEE